jgi:heme A synthase
MVLLMAFWWLRESEATYALARKPIAPLLRASVLVFLAHDATGAAASAYEMHNDRGFAFIHLGTSLLAIMFVGASLWDRRNAPSLSRWRVAIGALMVAQLALGFVLMSLGARPVWLAFVHGMLSPLLAIALVSLTVRDATAP